MSRDALNIKTSLMKTSNGLFGETHNKHRFSPSFSLQFLLMLLVSLND